VFGELFLQQEPGEAFWLNTTTGKMSTDSNSKEEFVKMAETREKRREWFVEQEMRAYAQRGLVRTHRKVPALVYLPFSPKEEDPGTEVCFLQCAQHS